MDPEFRFYYDENGDYIGAIFEGDPIPPGWTTYTILVPPSWDLGYNPPLEKWSFIKNNWYLPFTLQRLKEYRDSQIAINIEYGTFDILNNSESYTALGRICIAVPIENTENVPVSWKNIDGNYSQASYADMQELFKRCYRREQDCRDAEAVVLAIHSTTPYVDLGDAITDFDAAL